MPNDGERTLLRWAELWSAHDVDGLLSIFTDDCVYEDVAFRLVNEGKTDLRSFANTFLTACPDLCITLTSQFVSGSWAAMEWVMSGTQEGDFPGIAVTHKHFSIRGASVAELRGARIKRISDHWDLASLLKQIGD